MSKGTDLTPELPVTITVRVSVDEKRKLESDAASAGVNLSQFVRLSLFHSPSMAAANMSANDSVHATMLAAKSVRAEFKRIAPFYASIVEGYNRYVASVNDHPDKELIALGAKLERAVQGVESMTLDLQKSLNEFFVIAKTKETHTVAKSFIDKIDESAKNKVKPDGGLSLNDAKARKQFIIKHCYMQKIDIVGVISDDAIMTKNKDRMSFVVTVKSLTKTGTERSTLYRVFANMDDSFGTLKKGQQVFVSGELSISTREKDGKTFVDTVISAYTVTLFGLTE